MIGTRGIARSKTLRLILVVLPAILACIQAIRTAAVQAYAVTRPSLAAALWPGYPDVIFRREFERIGRMTAAGKPVPRNGLDRIINAARRAPLAPEPFLARGVDAQQRGEQAVAARAFVEARRRDPRSIAARYFLADHYQRTNQVQKGLREVSVLTRLVPQGSGSLAPYFAAFAQTPEGARQIRQLLSTDPTLEATILGALAADARNADLVLFLAGTRASAGNAQASWQTPLIQTLVAAGQYARAYTAWAKLYGIRLDRGEDLIFNPDFTGNDAPPPFNWVYGSAASGLAEVEGKGRLRILYYGRDNMTLASQLLLLRPGVYLLSFRQMAGDANADVLAWTVNCLPQNTPILDLNLGKASARAQHIASFRVPTGCLAQKLELTGTAPDFPATTDVAIGQLRLREMRAR